MTNLARLIPSFFVATAPTTDTLLLRLLRSRSADKQFVKRVRDVVFSKDALMAAKLLFPRDAQKVINRLDKALDFAVIAENKRFWRKCLKFLCRICGHHRLLPFSYKLTSALRKGDKPVGSGGFAEVWKGVYHGQQVAIKVLRVYETSCIEDIGRRFCREVLMWNRKSHPNILPLIGVSGQDFTMVSEWMENGNIREYVLTHPEVNRPSILLGAIDGLMYLHRRNLVHGDLKGANILIKQDGTSCLADFGLATIMPTETSSFLSPPSLGGTTRWMGPELLNPDERYGPPERTVHSDRYAFGMVMYEVLTGNIPFYFLPNPAVAAKVAAGGRPMIPVDTPVAAHKSGLWAIIQRCWEEDPIYRPALPEVRDRLFVAAGMWDDDLGRSGSTDGYVSVAQNILLSSSSGDSSDGENNDELEPGMSPFSLVQCSLRSTPERAGTPVSVNRSRLQNQSPHRPASVPLRNGRRTRAPSWYEPSQPHASESSREVQPEFYDSRQNLLVPVESNSAVGPVQEGVQSGDAESEYALEPPDFVYAEPESRR